MWITSGAVARGYLLDNLNRHLLEGYWYPNNLKRVNILSIPLKYFTIHAAVDNVKNH
jgi:hypothetical protein